MTMLLWLEIVFLVSGTMYPDTVESSNPLTQRNLPNTLQHQCRQLQNETTCKRGPWMVQVCTRAVSQVAAKNKERPKIMSRLTPELTEHDQQPEIYPSPSVPKETVRSGLLGKMTSKVGCCLFQDHKCSVSLIIIALFKRTYVNFRAYTSSSLLYKQLRLGIGNAAEVQLDSSKCHVYVMVKKKHDMWRYGIRNGKAVMKEKFYKQVFSFVLDWMRNRMFILKADYSRRLISLSLDGREERTIRNHADRNIRVLLYDEDTMSLYWWSRSVLRRYNFDTNILTNLYRVRTNRKKWVAVSSGKIYFLSKGLNMYDVLTEKIHHMKAVRSLKTIYFLAVRNETVITANRVFEAMKLMFYKRGNINVVFIRDAFKGLLGLRVINK